MSRTSSRSPKKLNERDCEEIQYGLASVRYNLFRTLNKHFDSEVKALPEGDKCLPSATKIRSEIELLKQGVTTLRNELDRIPKNCIENHRSKE